MRTSFPSRASSQLTNSCAISEQGLLGNIRRNQVKLSEAHERSKTVTRSAEMKEIREKMQSDIDEVNKIAHQVKNKLENLDKLNEQALGRKVMCTVPA